MGYGGGGYESGGGGGEKTQPSHLSEVWSGGKKWLTRAKSCGTWDERA